MQEVHPLVMHLELHIAAIGKHAALQVLWECAHASLMR
jgi:hypothetical protein